MPNYLANRFKGYPRMKRLKTSSFRLFETMNRMEFMDLSSEDLLLEDGIQEQGDSNERATCESKRRGERSFD